jgi:hypothetical protein
MWQLPAVAKEADSKVRQVSTFAMRILLNACAADFSVVSAGCRCIRNQVKNSKRRHSSDSSAIREPALHLHII